MENEIWERQPGEPPKAYFAFCAYRDLGPTRSLIKSARLMDKHDSYKKTIAEWTAKYSWVVRCEKYDHYENKLHRDQMEIIAEK